MLSYREWDITCMRCYCLFENNTSLIGHTYHRETYEYMGVSHSLTKILRMHSSTLVSALTVIKLEAPACIHSWKGEVREVMVR